MCVFLLEARFVFLYKKKKKILYLVFTAKGFFSPSHSKTVAKPLCSFAPGALGCWWKADVARGWLHSLCVFLCVGWGVEWDWKSIIIEGTMPRHLEWKEEDNCFWGVLGLERELTTGEAWCAAIHGVTKSRTRLSDWSDLIWCDGTGCHGLSFLNVEL